MKDNVLLCPFCGGPAETKELAAGYCVECVQCEAQGPTAKDEETAWTRWYIRESVGRKREAVTA